MAARAARDKGRQGPLNLLKRWLNECLSSRSVIKLQLASYAEPDVSVAVAWRSPGCAHSWPDSWHGQIDEAAEAACCCAAPRRGALPFTAAAACPPHFNHRSVPPGSPWRLATSLSPLSARRDLSRCGAPAEPRPDLPPAPIKRHRCATAFGWPAVALRAARTLLARCSAACAGCFALRAGCSRLSTNRASQSKTPQARRHAQVQGLLQCRPP